MDTIRLSLILCTLGRAGCLHRLLNSLAAQRCQDFELVVVDQNPPGYLDEFVAEAERHVRLLYLRSVPGLSRARNVGIKQAKGRLLGFPDDDCWYPPGFVEKIIKRFDAAPELSALTCRTVDELGRDSNGKFLQSTAAVTRLNVWYAGNSNGLFVRAALARQLGGFNEQLGVGSGTTFGSGEESDFLLRALAAGAYVLYLHDLHTYHDQVDAKLDASTMHRARLYARGFGRTLRLNRYPPGFAVSRALRSLAAALLSLIVLRPRRARFKYIWASGIVCGYLSNAMQARKLL